MTPNRQTSGQQNPSQKSQYQKQNQQENQDEDEHGDTAAAEPILVLPHDVLELLSARLEPPADPVSQVIGHLEHLPLLLELAAHVVGLPAQVAHRLEDAVQVHVLLAHHLDLLLVLKLGRVVCVVIVIVAVGDGERVWVRKVVSSSPLVACPPFDPGHPGQLLAHVLDLAADFLDEALAPCYFAGVEAILGRVVLDGLDGLDEVGEVLG